LFSGCLGAKSTWWLENRSPTTSPNSSLTVLLFCKPTCTFVLACVLLRQPVEAHTHTHTSSHQNRLVRILKKNTSQRHNHNNTNTKKRIISGKTTQFNPIPKQSQSFGMSKYFYPGQLGMSNCKGEEWWERSQLTPTSLLLTGSLFVLLVVYSTICQTVEEGRFFSWPKPSELTPCPPKNKTEANHQHGFTMNCVLLFLLNTPSYQSRVRPG
jgi:hypothetical protein